MFSHVEYLFLIFVVRRYVAVDYFNLQYYWSLQNYPLLTYWMSRREIFLTDGQEFRQPHSTLHYVPIF
jgi:hypothetical protein